MSVAIVVALATAGLPVVGQGGPEVPPELPQPIVPPSGAEGPAIPQLTEAEIAEAEAILVSYVTLKPLPGRYTVSEIGPWIDEENMKIGVGMLISLHRPVPPAEVKGEWLRVEFGRSNPTGYGIVRDEITDGLIATEFVNHQVQDFNVLIDLERGQVVELYPLVELPPLPEVVGGDQP